MDIISVVSIRGVLCIRVQSGVGPEDLQEAHPIRLPRRLASKLTTNISQTP
jgi:hypothetical protein